ncbi:MAG: thioredoxin family protein [Mollicutes bacterium]|nr:thioredoxin family protein [Mollicutes bacterium]
MKVLLFSATWCPSCLVMRPIWTKIKNEYKTELEEYDYDIDKEVIQKWDIGSKLPVAIIVDRNEVEITRIVGEKSKKEIMKIIEELKVKHESN